VNHRKSKRSSITSLISQFFRANYTMSIKRVEDTTMVELGAIENPTQMARHRTADKDRDDLVRLGKTPVLKVSPQLFQPILSLSIHVLSAALTNVFKEKFWFYVHCRLQLYSSDYLGSQLDSLCHRTSERRSCWHHVWIHSYLDRKSLCFLDPF
jgi:hypothetical protein